MSDADEFDFRGARRASNGVGDFTGSRCAERFRLPRQKHNALVTEATLMPLVLTRRFALNASTLCDRGPTFPDSAGARTT
jgi:hypothetical protein